MIDVKETLGGAEERMEMGAMYLEEQLARIRAGRANVAILDGVKVSSWGSMVPLNQVANVTVPDPRTIAIRPFDKKQIREIEKAIMDSDVGITQRTTARLSVWAFHSLLRNAVRSLLSNATRLANALRWRFATRVRKPRTS